MIEVRPFASLGHANHGWLDANFHFSFADYFNQRRMHWGALRVWNDDVIAPRNGFPAHSHADMEIITYVRAGAISHRDSLGNDGVTRAGDVQVMSAGTGITHAEFNQEDEPSHSFQLWIMPSRKGEAPRWDTRAFPKDDRAGNFVALASGDPADEDALRINADAKVLGALIKAGETVEYPLGAGRKAYLVVAAGSVELGGQVANARDGVAIADEPVLSVKALEDSELVLVDSV